MGVQREKHQQPRWLAIMSCSLGSIACQPRDCFAPTLCPAYPKGVFQIGNPLTGEHPECLRGVTAWLSPWKFGCKPEVH